MTPRRVFSHQYLIGIQRHLKHLFCVDIFHLFREVQTMFSTNPSDINITMGENNRHMFNNSYLFNMTSNDTSLTDTGFQYPDYDSVDIAIASTIFSCAVIGLLTNLVFFVASCLYRNMRKDTAYILVLNLILSDTGHLCLIVFHIEVERMIPSLEWPVWYEETVDHLSTLFWYCDLCNLLWIAMSRLVAICHTMHFKSWFSFKNVILMCVSSWIISIVMCLLPFTGLCCAAIFNIHYNGTEEALEKLSTNYLRVMVEVFNGFVVICLVYSYGRIITTLRRTARTFAAQHATMDKERREKERRKAKKNYLLVVKFLSISIIFMMLVAAWITDMLAKSGVTTVLIRTAYVVNSSSAPFLFLLLSAETRNEMRRLMCPCLRKEHAVGPQTITATPNMRTRATAASQMQANGGRHR